jgi:hypothetical protein
MPWSEQYEVIILTPTGGKAGAQSHEPHAGSSRSPLPPRYTCTNPGEGGTWYASVPQQLATAEMVQVVALALSPPCSEEGSRVVRVGTPCHESVRSDGLTHGSIRVGTCKEVMRSVDLAHEGTPGGRAAHRISAARKKASLPFPLTSWHWLPHHAAVLSPPSPVKRLYCPIRFSLEHATYNSGGSTPRSTRATGDALAQAPAHTFSLARQSSQKQ